MFLGRCKQLPVLRAFRPYRPVRHGQGLYGAGAGRSVRFVGPPRPRGGRISLRDESEQARGRRCFGWLRVCSWLHTKSSKHTGVAPFGDDAHEPAKRTEFHFYKNLQLDDEDEAEEPGSFRKRRTDFSVGTRVRWLKAAKTFVITKALYTARGLYLIHGTKDDDSGTIMGIFSPSELAVLPA